MLNTKMDKSELSGALARMIRNLNYQTGVSYDLLSSMTIPVGDVA